MAKNPFTGGDAQEALNLLYRSYTDDVRIFSCPSKNLSFSFLGNVAPFKPTDWPGAPGPVFKEALPGAAVSYSSSYGYSPGHDSSNSRVIIMADHKRHRPGKETPTTTVWMRVRIASAPAEQ